MKDEQELTRLVPATRLLLWSGLVFLALSVWAGALTLVGFDWPVGEVLRGTGAGTLLFGALYFFLEVRHDIPDVESLRAPPTDAEIDRRVVRPAWVLMLFPAAVPFVWLADRWDVGSVLVTGMFAGMAASRLAGAVLVRRWEREHGGRVLLRRDGSDDESEIYALPRAGGRG